MPAVFLDRLPLPSLQAYTTVSILLLSCSVYYAMDMTLEPEWELFKRARFDSLQMDQQNATFVQKLHLVLINNTTLKRVYEIMYFMVQEPLCIWTLINMAYCCLILLGKVIQKLVFGDLRVAEQQHIKDKFWNFVFYKFIFIFGVMNVQHMDEVVLWCSWFSILGFLHLLIQLCKDRYEYLSFSPTTPALTHVRLLTLLFGIFSTSCGFFAVCVFIGLQSGLNTFCFMAAECTLVVLRTLYVILRYSIHLWDITHEGVWERRISYTYYTDLAFDLAGLTVDFLHHLHMLLWGNILLSMASLVICMQLRYLFNEIQRRIKRHNNYLQVASYMETNYPEATAEEIESNSDDCAICWDRMESARKLPCGHLFHTSCLRSWLEQVSTCPTCRMSLISRDHDGPTPNDDINRNGTMQGEMPPVPPNQTTNHFFHFDGSRYVSWFPSFSVEVSHTSLLGLRHAQPVQTSQLDSMAYQVLQMFPHMPVGLIMDDLRLTRSVEHTIENILDERLVAPPSTLFQNTRREQSPQISARNTSQAYQVRRLPEEQETMISAPSASSSSRDSSILQRFQAEPENVEASPVRSGGDGCRFSKSSSEREQMLAHRKEDLLNKARSKYILKMLNSCGQGETLHIVDETSTYASSASSSSSFE